MIRAPEHRADIRVTGLWVLAIGLLVAGNVVALQRITGAPTQAEVSLAATGSAQPILVRASGAVPAEMPALRRPVTTFRRSAHAAGVAGASSAAKASATIPAPPSLPAEPASHYAPPQAPAPVGLPAPTQPAAPVQTAPAPPLQPAPKAPVQTAPRAPAPPTTVPFDEGGTTPASGGQGVGFDDSGGQPSPGP